MQAQRSQLLGMLRRHACLPKRSKLQRRGGQAFLLARAGQSVQHSVCGSIMPSSYKIVPDLESLQGNVASLGEAPQPCRSDAKEQISSFATLQ